ncbi:MAG: hypothetical protein KA974_07160, partial [Saprospiraceae bacterium]|nr:hypothetical protein [Saprospiraceae bacterium]
MKTKLYIILFNILFLSNIASTQEWWNNFAIQVGTTAAKPDTRYEYLYEQYPDGVVEHSKKDFVTYDNEYFVNLLFKQKIYKRLFAQVGLGYAQYFNDFKTPLGSYEYFDIHEDVFYYRKKLNYQFIQPNIQLNYLINLKNNFHITVGALLVYNYTFNKKVYYYKKYYFEKNKIERYRYEIYPTVSIGYSHFNLELGYRI